MSEPDNPQLKPLADLLSLTGVTAECVRLAVKGGFVPVPEKGKYRLAPALVGLIKFLNSKQPDGEFPLYDSMNQCAARSGIPLSVLKHAKKSGCDAFKWNRVDSGKLVSWLFASDAKNEDSRKIYDHYHAARERLKYEHEHGETLDKAETSFAISKAVSLCFTEFDKLANRDGPPNLKGRTEQEIRLELLKSVEVIKTALRDGLGALGETKISS